MKYALNIAEDGRILSATYDKYATADDVIVEELPSGDITDYRYVDGKFILDPLPENKTEEKPSQIDILEAQVTYTAMMTDTLLEV